MQTHTASTHTLTTCLAVVISVLSAEAAVSSPNTPVAVPTFHCIGLYWKPQHGSDDNICRVRYRHIGSDLWKTALPLWFDTRPPQTFKHLYRPFGERH